MSLLNVLIEQKKKGIINKKKNLSLISNLIINQNIFSTYLNLFPININENDAISTISIDFSKDGNLIATSHGDHTVKIFQYQKCLYYQYNKKNTKRNEDIDDIHEYCDIYSSHNEEIKENNNNNKYDKNNHICNGYHCILIHTLYGHPRTPWVVKWHPNINHILASGCIGGNFRIWNLNNSKNNNNNNHTEISATFPKIIVSIDWCKVLSNICIIASGPCLYGWILDTNAPILLYEFETPLRAIKFNHNCNYIIAAIASKHEDNTVIERRKSEIYIADVRQYINKDINKCIDFTQNCLYFNYFHNALLYHEGGLHIYQPIDHPELLCLITENKYNINDNNEEFNIKKEKLYTNLHSNSKVKNLYNAHRRTSSDSSLEININENHNQYINNNNDNNILYLYIFNINNINNITIYKEYHIYNKRVFNGFTSIRMDPSYTHLLIGFGKSLPINNDNININNNLFYDINKNTLDNLDKKWYKYSNEINNFELNNINKNDNYNENIQLHIVGILLRINDMKIVKYIYSENDFINIALFHPSIGNGYAYGTTQGKVRFITPYIMNEHSKNILSNNIKIDNYI